jgi:hypothetical protein
MNKNYRLIGLFVLVLQINRACQFWEWVDPKMCSHRERVVHRLQECHISLIQEAARCRVMVGTKVEKLKVKMETEEAERCQLVVEAEVAKSRANMECPKICPTYIQNHYHYQTYMTIYINNISTFASQTYMIQICPSLSKSV